MYTHPLIFVLPFAIFLPEDSLPKTEPKRTSAKGMDTSPPQEGIAILIRDESDINTIKEVFGDVLLGISPVTLRDPRSMKGLLISQITPVRSCFVIAESAKIKEELLTNSSSTVYLELLKTANRIVGENISSLFSLHTSLLYQEIRSSLPLCEFVTDLV